jgi:hypothetical protein
MACVASMQSNLLACFANLSCSEGLQTMFFKMLHWILQRRSLLDDRYGSLSNSASAGYLYQVNFNISSRHYLFCDTPIVQWPLKVKEMNPSIGSVLDTLVHGKRLMKGPWIHFIGIFLQNTGPNESPSSFWKNRNIRKVEVGSSALFDII